MKLKKIVALTLVLSLALMSTLTGFAETQGNESHVFTTEDVKALEKYVSCEEGIFLLDSEQALKDGVNQALVQGQLEYFELINAEARQGKLVINEDLSVEKVEGLVLDSDQMFATTTLGSGHAHNCGGGKTTSPKTHWWGKSRYFCDCASNDYAADLNAVAAVAGGAGVVGGAFGGIGAIPGGINCAYFWYFASRVDKNNNGHGIFVELTWLIAFDITPQ